ncbi:hypothetical protein GCM10022215_00920 [Nocardioides fonticola]|uniref:MotA/TolQ/ExbB proton channel domain-containing protein n=1 Tax=Nocardioides fonticola TaxID=450363 RepID=A0ABP7X8Z5_9ACTN
MDRLYDLVFDAADALEGPVVVLALLALAAVVVEVGSLLIELLRRRGRRLGGVALAAADARLALDAGDRDAAVEALQPVSRSADMLAVLTVLARLAGPASAEPLLAKELADFDFAAQRRLARTRLLVRFGPALGLMGTLIPLSPALEGLASGDVETLAQNLRVAFSITVLGLLVGAVAYALTITRERLYDQDHSDLEYVAAILTADLDGSAPPQLPADPEAEPEAAPGSGAEDDTPARRIPRPRLPRRRPAADGGAS